MASTSGKSAIISGLSFESEIAAVQEAAVHARDAQEEQAAR